MHDAYAKLAILFILAEPYVAKYNKSIKNPSINLLQLFSHSRWQMRNDNDNKQSKLIHF